MAWLGVREKRGKGVEWEGLQRRGGRGLKEEGWGEREKWKRMKRGRGIGCSGRGRWEEAKREVEGIDGGEMEGFLRGRDRRG